MLRYQNVSMERPGSFPVNLFGGTANPIDKSNRHLPMRNNHGELGESSSKFMEKVDFKVRATTK